MLLSMLETVAYIDFHMGEEGRAYLLKIFVSGGGGWRMEARIMFGVILMWFALIHLTRADKLGTRVDSMPAGGNGGEFRKTD